MAKRVSRAKFLWAVKNQNIGDLRRSPAWYFFNEHFDMVLELRRTGTTWHAIAEGLKKAGVEGTENATARSVRRTFRHVAEARQVFDWRTDLRKLTDAGAGEPQHEDDSEAGDDDPLVPEMTPEEEEAMRRPPAEVPTPEPMPADPTERAILATVAQGRRRLWGKG